MQKGRPKAPIQKIIDSDYGGDGAAFLRDVESFAHGHADIPKKAKPKKLGPILIDVKAAERTYSLSGKNRVKALTGVDLRIREGEIVALTGPSGSGKSTLMHIIAGLDRPTAGQVVVDGHRVDTMSEGKLAAYRNKTVGVVFQFFYLQPFLNLDRNVEVPLMFARTKRATRHKPVGQVIEAVNLSNRSGFRPKELSGGQMQRVAIARALVNKPKILLADEPTGNLDSKNSDDIMALMQSIRERLGTTMIIVTHDPRVAAWADRIVRMEDGRVAA